jgi:hypothetical protein
MRLNKQLYPILIIISCLILFTSCSRNGDDNDTPPSWMDFLSPDGVSPTEVDLYIALINYEDVKSRNDNYVTSIFAINPNLFGADLTLSINGSPVDVLGLSNAWFVEYDYEQGQNYLFEISVNNTNYSISIVVPYVISVINFPQTFNPSQPAEVTWALSANNQNQIAQIFAEDLESDETDEFFRELNTSNRSYVFPANAVDDFGDFASYYLSIMQINFNSNDNIAVIAVSNRERDYGNISKNRDGDMDLDKIIRLMTK